MAIGVEICCQDEVVLVLRFLDHPAQVAAFESGFEDQYVVLFSLGDVEWEHVELEGRGLHLFGEGRRIFAVVDDCVDVVLGEDDGFDLPAQGLLEDVVLGEVHCLVGVVGGVQLWLRGQENIVRDTFEGEFFLGRFSVELFVYAVEFFLGVMLLHIDLKV